MRSIFSPNDVSQGDDVLLSGVLSSRGEDRGIQ